GSRYAPGIRRGSGGPPRSPDERWTWGPLRSSTSSPDPAEPSPGRFPVRSMRMQTTVEETDKHVVRLTVEIPPEEFERDLDRAYRKVAGQVKIPGFRKGKVPKQIIDARIGR